MATPNDNPVTPTSSLDQAAPGVAECTSCNWLRRMNAATASILLFLFCLYLYTRNNTFIYQWHPDEPQKTRQVMGMDRLAKDAQKQVKPETLKANDPLNYKHPLMLLEASYRLCGWLDTPMNDQAIAETGRLFSAACAALAVVALALVGYWIGGLTGFGLAALATIFCPSLLVYAHYMKEDTALVMGLCLTLLATKVFWNTRKPVARGFALVFLGLACGLAVSGKYSGTYALLAVAPLILLAPPYRWYGPIVRVLTVAVVCAAVFCIINYRVFESPLRLKDKVVDLVHFRGFTSPLFKDKFKEAFIGEKVHGMTDHYGVSMKRPNTFFIEAVRRECQPHVLALAGVFVLMSLAFMHRNGPWDLYAVLFAGGYLAMISWCVIPQNRYALPVVVMVHLFAALGVVRLAGLFHASATGAMGVGGWVRVSLPVAMIAVIGVLQVPRCLNFLGQFNNDSRGRLVEWVKQNVKPGESIATDNWTELRRAQFYRTRIMTSRYVPDRGDLVELRRSGIKYIAVAEQAYGRFFDPRVYAVEQSEAADAPGLKWPKGEIIGPERFAYYRAAYDEIFNKAELVWKSDPQPPTYAFTNPSIRVYRIPPAEKPTTRPAQ